MDQDDFFAYFDQLSPDEKRWALVDLENRRRDQRVEQLQAQVDYLDGQGESHDTRLDRLEALLAPLLEGNTNGRDA